MEKDIVDIEVGAALQRAADRRAPDNPIKYMMHLNGAYVYVHEGSFDTNIITSIDTAFAEYAAFQNFHATKGASREYTLKDVFDVKAMAEDRRVVRFSEERLEQMRNVTLPKKRLAELQNVFSK
jgi:hypothetical protein